MSAELLDLLDSDPAAGILATADRRERLANNAAPGPYETYSFPDARPEMDIGFGTRGDETGHLAEFVSWELKTAKHIAAEANPDHALAAVRRWRGVVERHQRAHIRPMFPQDEWSPLCVVDHDDYPCPDLTETADEAKAYLGGTR